MTKIRLLAALGLSAILYSASSSYAFELSFVGGTTFASPSVESGGTTSTYSSKAAYGGGIILGFSLNPVTELEIGGLYMGRHFTSSAIGEDLYYNYEFPVLLRLVPLKYITLGAGVYGAVPTGVDTNTVGSSASTVDAGTRYKKDFGAVGSVGIKFPVGVASDFLLDGRYYYGVTNATELSGLTMHTRDLEILAGINFNF